VTPTLIDDAAGRLRLTVARDGQEVTRDLDVFLAFDTLLDIRTETEGRPHAAYWERVAAWADGQGFPGVSVHALLEITQAVFARVDELRKKPAGGSASAV